MAKDDWPPLSVFVSYSRADKEFADRLSAAIEDFKDGNVKILIDRRDLPYGEKWWDMLVDFIDRCDRVIFIVSPDSIKSGWCKKELEEIDAAGRRLIPIVARETPIADVPAEIKAINLMPFTDTAAFDVQVAKLVVTLYQNVKWSRSRRVVDTLSGHWAAHERPRSLLLGPDQISYFRAWQDERPPIEPALSKEALEYFDYSGFFALKDDHYSALRTVSDRLDQFWMWWAALVAGIVGVIAGGSLLLNWLIADHAQQIVAWAGSIGTSSAIGGLAGWLTARWMKLRQQDMKSDLLGKETVLQRYGALDDARAWIEAQKQAEAELAKKLNDAKESGRREAQRSSSPSKSSTSTSSKPSAPAPEPVIADKSPQWGHQ